MRKMKSLREETVFLTVITYGGKRSYFSKSEVLEMIDNPDMYKEADSLPKWIFMAVNDNKSYLFEVLKALGFGQVRTFAQVFEFLEALTDFQEVAINVRSDIPDHHSFAILR